MTSRFELPRETQRALKVISQQTQEIGRALAASVVLPKIQLPPLPTDFIRRMEGIFELMAESVRRAWPPNWEDDGWATGVMLDRMDIIDVEGLPLVWVPRAELVVELTEQDGADARIALLLDRAGDAIDACEEQLGHVDDASLAPMSRGISRALAAWRDGHPDAAQALATAALDTTVTRSYGLKSYAAAREFDIPLEEVPISVVREAMVLVAVHRAWGSFDAVSDPIPDRYNRHASVHAVSPQQYTEANAVVALLLTTSLLRERHAELNPE